MIYAQHFSREALLERFWTTMQQEQQTLITQLCLAHKQGDHPNANS